MTVPLILQIQAEAMESTSAVSSLLRKAKAAAMKLDLATDLVWIEHELSGYEDGADLPAYRVLYGDLKVFNPYHGWQQVQFKEGSELEDTIRRCPMRNSISHIEWLVSQHKPGGDAVIAVQLSSGQQAVVHRLISQKLEASVHLNPARVAGIIEAVKNLVLDWSLKMEKAGVVGEDFSFSPKEKQLAAPVSQMFYNIQNVGTLGNVGANANISNIQGVDSQISISDLGNALREIRQNLQSAPTTLREKIGPVLSELEAEAQASKPDHSKLRGLLGSVKTIAEGAAGSLIATGIVGLVAPFLR